jgi:hypothetical protein
VETLIAVLPSAIAFAISPIGIVEMILVLFSRRSRVNGIVFLVVVIVPTILIPLAGAKAYDVASDASSSATSTGAAILLVVLAALLLWLALGNWRRRTDPSAPAVFAKIDGMGPGAVAILALGITVANPKNLALLLATGKLLGSSGLTGTELLLAVALFAVLATLPFLVVIGYRLLGGVSAEGRLDGWKATLLAKNRLIMAIVLGALGVLLVIKGVGAL